MMFKLISTSCGKRLSMDNYNFCILLLFSLIDVFLYGIEGIDLIKFLFSCLVYAYLVILFFINKKNAILYLISFNLLTIGWGNYYHLDNSSLNYWGIRFGRVSLNIVIQFFFCVILILKRRLSISYCMDPYSRFLLIYLIWIAVVGFVNVLFGNIYSDNYIDDLLAILPVLFYFVLFKNLDVESLKKVLIYTFSISVISLLFAFLLHRKMEYGGSEFVVYNSLYYLLPCGVFIMRKYYTSFFFLIFCCDNNIFAVNQFLFCFRKNDYKFWAFTSLDSWI